MLYNNLLAHEVCALRALVLKYIFVKRLSDQQFFALFRLMRQITDFRWESSFVM